MDPDLCKPCRRARPAAGALLLVSAIWPTSCGAYVTPQVSVATHRHQHSAVSRESGYLQKTTAAQQCQAPCLRTTGRRCRRLLVRPLQAAASPPAQDPLPSGGKVKGLALAAVAFATSVQPNVMLASTKAVVKLAASCAVGFVCSKKGVLDQQALSSLSKLIFYVFQPCLLFVNVASTLGAAGGVRGLSKLAVLPVFAVAQILVGYVLATGLGLLTGTDPNSDEGRELKMCASFANSGPLPLLFVDSLFGGHADATLLPTAISYISFYLLGWSPMFWTAGYSILAGAPPKGPPPPLEEASAGAVQQLWGKITRTVNGPTFSRIMSPPVLGCIAGAVVGITPFLSNLLLGRTALLSPVFDALKGLGMAYLPAAIMVLAGSLAKPVKAPESSAKGGFAKRVAAVMLARFLFMPLAAASMLLLGHRAQLIPYEKALWFVLLMEGCMPSAQNSVVILQMENKPQQASSMARTLTAVYLLSALPIAVLLSGILQYVQL